MVQIERDNSGSLTARRFPGDSGFGLVELLMLIVIIGILAAIATSSLDTALGKHRQAKTEREMEAILKAIAGDPTRMTGGIRSDFGYVGDVGAFPTSLDQLYGNPGYTVWDGPYVDVGLIQDSTGFLVDEWGSSYQYDGSLTISSTGSGTTLSASLTGSTEDYLINLVIGLVTDAEGNNPGGTYADSVELSLTIPNGIGGVSIRQINPLWNGSFEFDSLPVGRLELNVVYIPTSDTLHRVVTVLPRNRNDRPLQFRLPSAYFAGGGAGTSSMTLRPDGAGSATNLTTDGCASNYLCVDESLPDEDATRVGQRGNGTGVDLYSLENPSTTTGTINSVTAFMRARKGFVTGVGGTAELQIMTHSGQYTGATEDLTTSYADYSNSWTLNPATSAAWTWTEITDLEAGISLVGNGTTKYAYSTQVWLVVEYTP